MRHRLKAFAALPTVVALSSLLAACGSSSKNEAGGGGSSTTVACTGDPVPIGNIGTYSSPTGAVSDPAVGRKATQAWADWVNAHGCINGHPIKLFVEDDANDAV